MSDFGPINTVLNYIEAKYTFKDFSMVGISGGGCTTHLYAAVDPRIKTSFPVAGSLPRYLRTAQCSSNLGHSEGDEGTGAVINGKEIHTVGFVYIKVRNTP